MTKDLLLFEEMMSRSAQARLDLLADPHAFVCLTVGGSAPNMRHYWAIVRDLRTKVRAAAAMHWHLIQEAAEWSACWDLARRWSCAQYGLARLTLGGLARHCHVVDIIDAESALDAIESL